MPVRPKEAEVVGAGAPVSPAVPALLGAMLLWGATYVVTKFALAGAGAATVLFLRLAIGALVLAPFARRRGLRWDLVARRELVLFGLTGMVLHLGFEIVGLEFTSASSAALVIATAPAVTVAFSIALLGERLTPLRWLGIGASVVGVILVTRGQPDGAHEHAWLGNLLVFAGVIAWGIFTVQGKRMPPGRPAIVTTTAATAAAALMTLPVALAEVALWEGMPSLDASSILAVVYLGIGASGVAYGLWNVALRHVDAAVAAPFINLVPVLGVAFALLAGESISSLQLVGGATVGAGVWLSHRG